jgi:hypothetical protein
MTKKKIIINIFAIVGAISMGVLIVNKKESKNGKAFLSESESTLLGIATILAFIVYMSDAFAPELGE